MATGEKNPFYLKKKKKKKKFKELSVARINQNKFSINKENILYWTSWVHPI